ncbi:MAG: cystathionine beta-lyase, partial [Pseudomonadota bacterium]
MQKKLRHAHTHLTHAGRQENEYGSVNPRVVRASTMVFPTTQALTASYGTRLSYGRHGTETTFALEDALCKLEKADDCILSSSGLAAVTTALLAFLNTGDHLLISDSVYDPTRDFCDSFLKRMGIQTTYYDPEIGENIEALIQSNTKVIFVESPGSLTFEVQDIPAIANVAHRHNIVVIADSTWATPLGWNAFELGIDVSLHAATKYIVGHADVLMGAILCRTQHQAPLRKTHRDIGHCISSDDAYLALRGLRTLAARLVVHRENSQVIARWLLEQPEVEHLLYPPHPTSSGHALWKRDFNANYACGLMGVIFSSQL